jgi:hypothetical protein
MPDLDKLRRLAEESKRTKDDEWLRQRENEKNEEEEHRYQEKLNADEQRYRRIITNIDYFTEREAREGKHEAAIMNIGQGGVENFQRIKRHFWSGGYEDHNVKLSQVTDEVARRVFAHCKCEGLNPQIRWNPNNSSWRAGDPSYEDDMFQLFVRW